MLYYLAKRYRLKWLKKLFCKIGWHSDIDGYSMLNFEGKIYCRCPWCGKHLDVESVFMRL